ncbi:MAG: hypothetical protein WCP16_08010 [Pseudanabaena sp. ELA645]|jgi:hypothetical protein
MSKLKSPKRLNTNDSRAFFILQPKSIVRARKAKVTQPEPEIINGYKVNRLLRWYEKDGNALIGETPLKGCSLTELQKILNEPTNSPMFFSYQLTDEQVGYFERKLKQAFDLSAYEYFLECDAV